MSLREIVKRSLGVVFVCGMLTVMFFLSGKHFYSVYLESHQTTATYMNGKYVVFGAGYTSRDHLFDHPVKVNARICNISKLGSVQARPLTDIEAMQPPFCNGVRQDTLIVENAVVSSFAGPDVVMYVAESDVPFTLTTIPVLSFTVVLGAFGFVIIFLLFVGGVIYSAINV